ncbi:MAG: c-type cytochrome [Pseudomonadales bacterium]|jgi:cytochrome c oxidase subunit 2|nr:c-type cytochrome [Pseudomonadales bacterium]
MRLICLLFALLPLAAMAEDTAVPGEGPYDYCIVCHGTEGRGNVSINAPRIGGLDAWYIERQLLSFRAGWRGTHEGDYHGGEMRPMAMALADAAAVRGAAEYFAAFAAPELMATVEGDAGRGRTLYATCTACHGPEGLGNEALGAPALAGQSDWYMVRQLEHFRSGVRGAADGDSYGAQMAGMSGALVDEQAIRDVVAYINTLD